MKAQIKENTGYFVVEFAAETVGEVAQLYRLAANHKKVPAAISFNVLSAGEEALGILDTPEVFVSIEIKRRSGLQSTSFTGDKIERSYYALYHEKQDA